MRYNKKNTLNLNLYVKILADIKSNYNRQWILAKKTLRTIRTSDRISIAELDQLKKVNIISIDDIMHDLFNVYMN